MTWIQCIFVLVTWLWWETDSAVSSNDTVSDVRLRRLVEELWQWKLKQFPEFATRKQFHQYDDALESFSLNTLERRQNRCLELLREADRLQDAGLGTADELTLDILRDQLTTYTQGYRWRDYGNLNPVNSLEGVQKSTYMYWVSSAKFITEADYKKYLRRLEALPRQIDEVITLMKRAMKLRRTNHASSMRDVPTQLDALISVPPEATRYYEPFNHTCTQGNLCVPDVKRQNLRKQGLDVIKAKIQPAFRKLRDFIMTDYMAATRPNIGVSSFPRGTEYYQELLRWHLSLDIEAEEVHQTGLREVARIKAQMEQIMVQVHRYGSLRSFFSYLKGQTRFFNHTQVQLLGEYKHTIYQRISPTLHRLFTNISNVLTVKVKAMPDDGPMAQYFDGTFWANIFRPQDRAKYNVVALCLHESIPGHHLQIQYAEMQSLPDFRRWLWGGRKFSAPFHFPYYTAYVEGWGLYAEYLGEELGLYTDPYDLFGRYSFEMFRACRLVVDTGIHVKGWTRNQAIEYMLNYTALSRNDVEKEVDRYITWPGQACAYKIGEIKLRQLRSMAEDKLGELFDVAQFHRTVLRTGGVPLHVLERVVRKWIDVTLAASSSSCLCSPPVVLVVLSLLWCQAH